MRAFRSVGGKPVFIARGQGSHIFDVDGNEYIDYVGSWGPLLLGHRHPAILEALEGALAIGTSFGAPTEQEIELAEAICDAVPSIEMVRLVNSGTEATMWAIRVARGFTGRDLIVKFEGCYHGHVDSLLVKAGSGMATLGIADTQGVPEGLLRYHHRAALQFARSGGRGLSHAWRPHRRGDRGAGGGQHGLRAAAPGLSCKCCARSRKRHGALLIFDEVMTGFRVAFGGAQQRYGVTPDLTTLGKVIGGGLARGRLRRAQRHHEQGGARGAGLPGRDAVRQSAGGGRGAGHAAPPESASRNLRAVGNARRRALRHRVPAGITVNRVGSMFTFFFTGAGDGLGIGQKQRHGPLRPLLPRHAGPRHLSGAVAIRSRAFVSAAHTEEDIAKTVAAARGSVPEHEPRMNADTSGDLR